MPTSPENISSDLVNLLKDRFEISDCVDETGKFTDDPTKMKVFSFDFINSKGINKGSIVISLLDDSESSNSLKIYFGQDLADSDPETLSDWRKFLQEIRQFTKIHLLGFDVRNINKSRLTRRDVEHDLKLTTEDIQPMYESTFSPIDGTVKTSKQKLGNMEIIIKHTEKIDPHVKYGRSRKIQKIYLSNSQGERFLLPFKSLIAARAMARHIEDGGTPYDNIGRDICQLVEEMLNINKFYRNYKNNNFSNPRAIDALNAARGRYLEIKKLLSSMSSKGGYERNKNNFTGHEGEFDDDEMYDNVFDEAELKDEDQLSLPYIMRAYQNHPGIEEEYEFESWSKNPNNKLNEEQINELFGMSDAERKLKNKIKIENEFEKMNKFMEWIGFESTESDYYHTSWKRRYFYIILDILGDKPEFRIYRNHRPTHLGEGYNSLIKAIFSFDEFRDYKRDYEKSGLLKKIPNDLEENISDNISFGSTAAENLLKAARLLRIHSYSSVIKTFLSKAYDETQNKEIVDAIKMYDEKDFNNLRRKIYNILKSMKNQLTEADIPVSAAANGPLTWPHVFLGSKFRTNKEIKDHKNETGKLSPLSLLNSPEKDTDENGDEVPKEPIITRRSVSLPNDASGIDSMSQY